MEKLRSPVGREGGMEKMSLNYLFYMETLLFSILGMIFLYSGFNDCINLKFLHTSVRFFPYVIKLMSLIFIPGLKLTIGLIYLFKRKERKAACMVAFVFLLLLEVFYFYNAMTVEICGTCGEFRKNTLLYEVWFPVVIYFIFLILNSVAFFIAPDINIRDSLKN